MTLRRVKAASQLHAMRISKAPLHHAQINPPFCLRMDTYIHHLMQNDIAKSDRMIYNKVMNNDCFVCKETIG